MAFSAGGIKALAAKNVKTSDVPVANVISGEDQYSLEDDYSMPVNRCITFAQAKSGTDASIQTKTAAVKASSKTASASKSTLTSKSTLVSKGTQKSSSTSSKKAAAKTTSTSTKTAASTSAVKSKTVASRGTTVTRTTTKALEAVSIAKQYTGTAYVYGGASAAGFDCSGFTMFVYSKLSVSLPHSAAKQYGYGTKISKISDLKPGDLVFFYSPISHVGIYIGDGKFIHAANPKKGVVITDIYDSSYNNDFVGGVRLFQ